MVEEYSRDNATQELVTAVSPPGSDIKLSDLPNLVRYTYIREVHYIRGDLKTVYTYIDSEMSGIIDSEMSGVLIVRISTGEVIIDMGTRLRYANEVKEES